MLVQQPSESKTLQLLEFLNKLDLEMIGDYAEVYNQANNICISPSSAKLTEEKNHQNRSEVDCEAETQSDRREGCDGRFSVVNRKSVSCSMTISAAHLPTCQTVVWRHLFGGRAGKLNLSHFNHFNLFPAWINSFSQFLETNVRQKEAERCTKIRKNETYFSKSVDLGSCWSHLHLSFEVI